MTLHVRPITPSDGDDTDGNNDRCEVVAFIATVLECVTYYDGGR